MVCVRKYKHVLDYIVEIGKRHRIVVSHEITHISLCARVCVSTYVHPCLHARNVIIPILLNYAVEIGIRDITTV
jgi:hypothetical protein